MCVCCVVPRVTVYGIDCRSVQVQGQAGDGFAPSLTLESARQMHPCLSDFPSLSLATWWGSCGALSAVCVFVRVYVCDVVDSCLLLAEVSGQRPFHTVCQFLFGYTDQMLA